jgi:hypothetical protein
MDSQIFLIYERCLRLRRQVRFYKVFLQGPLTQEYYKLMVVTASSLPNIYK